MKKLFTLFLFVTTCLTFATAQEREPNNNDFAGADTLTLGLTDTARIQNNGDADFFLLQLPQCRALIIGLINVPGINLQVHAYSHPHIDSAIGYSGYGGNRVLEVSAPSGNVYLRVSDRFGNSNSNVFYRLLVIADSVDTRECNNDFGTAYPISDSTSFNATMRGGNSLQGPAVDIDFYRVHVTKCGTLVLNLINVPGINLQIHAYSAPHIDSLIGYSGYGGNRILELTPVPEFVYVRISDRFSNTSATPYNLTVSIDTADPWECNNSFATASPVPDNITLTAKMRGSNSLHSPVVDVDFYKVQMSKCGTLQLRLTNIPGINLQMHAYSAPHIDSVIGYSGYGGNRTLEVTGSAGDVYIRISDRFDNTSSTVPYTLTITRDTLDFYECNNDFATASLVPYSITISARIQGSSNGVVDVDFYKVHVTQCGTLVLNLTNIPGINLQIHAYNAPHIDSLIGYSGYGGNRILELTPVPEFVYVRISDRFSNTSTGTYTLDIRIDSIDVYECNNQFSTAHPIPYNITLNAKIRGYNELHSPVSDIDIYKITVPKCGVLVCNLTNVPGINLQMHMYAGAHDSTQVGYSGYGGNRSLEIFVSPGDWYLKVSDRFGDRSANPYTLQITLDTSDACECNNTFTDACTVSPNSTFQARIRGTNSLRSPQADVDYYRLDIPLCGRLVANLTNVSGRNYQVTAYKSPDTTNNVGYSGYGGNRTLTLDLFPGTYYLRVEDRFGEVSPNAYTLALTFTPNPAVPVLTPAGPHAFCLGDSIVLTTSSIIPHKWSTGDSTTSITIYTRGVYADTVRLSNGCTAISDPIIVEADSMPAVPVITPAGPTTFCDGGSVVLSSSASTNNYWSTAETSASITVTAAGAYIDTVKANRNCYAVSAPIDIVVNPNPTTPVITPLGTVTVCENGSATLYSSVATGNSWSTGDTTNSIVVTQPGTYTDTVTNQFGCIAISAPATVVQSDLPQAGFTHTNTGPSYTFTNTSAGGITYRWNFGDGNTSTDANPTHNYTSSGAKTVTLITTNPCGNDTFTTIINVVGISEIASDKWMQVVPNPCSVCELSGNVNAADLVITDLTGRVCAASFTPTGKGYRIELPAYANGVYFIQNRETKQVVKFIKQ